MGQDPLVTMQLTGILLLLSVLLPMIGILAIARGDLSGYQASIRGIEGVGESADILRRTFPLSSLVVVLTLISFGMLSILLNEAGGKGIALLAFVLLMFSQVFQVFQGTFHSSVTVWASKELASSGSVPALFEPLWRWMYSTVQQIYVNIGLLSIAAYGWAILETGLLPAWLGWFSIGWGLIWLIPFAWWQDNLPLVLFVPPLVIGIVAIAVA
jgi:hypothetical protein